MNHVDLLRTLLCADYYSLFVILCLLTVIYLFIFTEFSQLQQLSGNPGLFKREGARPEVLEKALHVSAALWALLLD